jgi:hypothetical protein
VQHFSLHSEGRPPCQMSEFLESNLTKIARGTQARGPRDESRLGVAWGVATLVNASQVSQRQNCPDAYRRYGGISV